MRFNYCPSPAADSSLFNISASACQPRKLFSGISDRLSTFSHLSPSSFQSANRPYRFPPPICLLIIPFFNFSTLPSCLPIRSLTLSVYLSLLAAVVPTAGLRNHASVSSFFAGSTPGYWHIKEPQTAETGRLLE